MGFRPQKALQTWVRLGFYINELVECLFVEGVAHVFPEVFAVTAHALVGTVADVDGQGHLIRHFLKNNLEVSVF